MNKKVIYTCITGGYDDLNNYTFLNNEWDYVCFTDNPEQMRNENNSRWDIRPIIFSKLDNVRNQRWHKLHPHMLLPEYRESVWVDASINIIDKVFFDEIDKISDEKEKISIPVHPDRDCIYKEALACIKLGKDDENIINEEVKFLRDNNFPEKQGLFETGIIYREHLDSKIIKAMEEWWSLIERYSRRDQLSLNYVLWKQDLKVRPLNRQGIEFVYNKKHSTKEELLVQKKELEESIVKKDQEIIDKNTEINDINLIISLKDKEIMNKNQELEKLNQVVNLKSQELEEVIQTINLKNQEIEFMKSSRFWKLKTFYEKFKNPILKILRLSQKGLLVLKKEGPIVFLKKMRSFFIQRKGYIEFKIKQFLQDNKKRVVGIVKEELISKKKTSLIKPIAMYLPQFHENDENNKWWGDGFTEWNHIRSFKPLFDGHTVCKPHSDIGYYDLTNIEIRKKQAEMAREYGVYGFCYYHYWSTGRLLLNKPTELMMQDGEPDLPFMFSWANHDWTRKWENKGTDILWKQEYGEIDDWEDHFKYLLEFFKHPNYIKVDNKPCFIIYVPSLVPKLEHFIEYWNKRAITEGFAGINFIGTELSFDKQKKFYKSELFDSYYTQEPSHVIYSKDILVNKGRYNSLNSKKFYKEIEKFVSPIRDTVTYTGTCVGFDNTSRIKSVDNIALIMTNNSPELFKDHLKILSSKLKSKGNSEEFLFINAWNEWGEGAILEPSDKYGYKYLQAVKESVGYFNRDKVLIIAEITSITGSPMYNYSLAMEFKDQGYEVDLFSLFPDDEIKKRLLQNGVSVISKIDIDKEYKLALISQSTHANVLKIIKSENIFNIIHSEYEEETPIELPTIDKYIAIRPSIKEHLINEHGIDKEKIEIIYNGVDLKRFNLDKKKKHNGDYVKVVLPCTIHELRIPFIKYYIDKANENYRVYIYGHGSPLSDFNVSANEWVFVEDVKFDIENYIFDADIVAGILLGRVNLEARAMGIKNYIHNPLNPEDFHEFELDDSEFHKRHDIKNVVMSIVDLFNKKILPKTETKNLFTNYFESNYWGDTESFSGTGSNLQQTKTLIEELPRLLKKFNIKSMLDIPCGDFNWMRKVDLAGIKYTGADIVENLIKWCSEKYPSREFKVLDLINSKLPKVDLIFCRDCLVHLPNFEIKKALQNIKNSGSKYLLTTTFTEHKNSDIRVGEWRTVDLHKEPFNLIAPIFTIKENCTENNGDYSDKSMCLWKIDDLIL